jgi:AcrR family transcriptional regulator
MPDEAPVINAVFVMLAPKNQQLLTLYLRLLSALSTCVDKFFYSDTHGAMTKAQETREKLLLRARTLLWRHGYSNVSLRQIATAAGVDVALVSRYFGGKRGLFEATLEGAFDSPDAHTAEALVNIVVHLFVSHPRTPGAVSILNLLLMNAQDEEVGEMVREAQRVGLQEKTEQAIGDPVRAAMFIAVIMGISVAEKSLQLHGIAPGDALLYEAQLRHMLEAALTVPVAPHTRT